MDYGMDLELPYILMFVFTTLTHIVLLLRNRHYIRKGNVIWGSMLFIIVARNYLYISSNHYGIFPFDLVDETITSLIFFFALLWPLMGLAVSQRKRGIIIYLIIHTFILTIPSIYFDYVSWNIFAYFIIGSMVQHIFIGIIVFDFVGLTLMNIGAAIDSD